jgi:hypothetical protein
LRRQGRSIRRRRLCAGIGWTLANACEQAGLPVVGDEKALTKGYFNAIKSVV